MSERNRKPNQYRVAGRMAAAFLVTLAIGCTKSDKQDGQADTDTSRAGATVAPDTSVTPATDPGLDDVPGRNPANTRAYLARFDGHWTASQRAKIHCDSIDCAGNDSVSLEFIVHELTWKIDAPKIIAENVPGHIVAKIINHSAFLYETLGLAANDSAYLWVGKTDTAAQALQPIHRSRAFAVFRIDQQGRATLVSRVYRAIRCYGPPEVTSSDVHLRRRDQCEPGRTKEVLYSDVLPPSFTPTPFHDQGLWFSCEGGCCQANSFGQ